MPGSPGKKAEPNRIKVFAISIAVVLVVLIALRVTFSLLAIVPPSPSKVARLLNADDAFKLPVTATLLTELTEEWSSGNKTNEALLEDRVAARALERLGLATVDHSSVQIPPDCYHYDEVARYSPTAMRGEEWIEVRNPNGKFQRCDDLWRYTTTITLKDPETIDKEWIAERVSSLSDVGLTTSGYLRKGSFESTTVPIGAIEIVEVSDVVRVKGQDTYTVGFKCRFKPNSLGELFDVSSSIFKSIPLQVRKHFVDTTHYLPEDKRLLYIDATQLMQKLNTGRDGDGIALGHAELIKEGLFEPQWKVKQVSFDQLDHTEYAFHQIEKGSP
jgi:hypothetical protein